MKKITLALFACLISSSAIAADNDSITCNNLEQQLEVKVQLNDGPGLTMSIKQNGTIITKEQVQRTSDGYSNSVVKLDFIDANQTSASLTLLRDGGSPLQASLICN